MQKTLDKTFYGLKRNGFIINKDYNMNTNVDWQREKNNKFIIFYF